MNMAALEIFLISFATVVAQNVLFKRLSDQAALKELRLQTEKIMARQKEVRKSGDLDKYNELLKEQSDLQMKRLNLTMKPNMLSSFAFILAVMWMQKTYAATKIILPLAIPIPVWHWPPIALTSTLGWFGWYLLIALTSSLIVRDVLGIEI